MLMTAMDHLTSNRVHATRTEEHAILAALESIVEFLLPFGSYLFIRELSPNVGKHFSTSRFKAPGWPARLAGPTADRSGQLRQGKGRRIDAALDGLLPSRRGCPPNPGAPSCPPNSRLPQRKQRTGRRCPWNRG